MIYKNIWAIATIAVLFFGSLPDYLLAASPEIVGSSPAGKYPRWQGGRSIGSNDPRWKIVQEREADDPAWQAKMPIDFFGKVVDVSGEPVRDAVIKFSWNDLSESGSSHGQTTSDGNGLFSLVNVAGKFLGVEVHKDGYYASRLNPFGFEFAYFSDDDFYDPDPKNPVIFHLRKKQPGEPMIYREQEIKIATGVAGEVALDTGEKIKIELLSNPRPKQGPWAMRVTLPAGGFQPATEEFPFTAPVDGYQSSLLLDDATPKPPKWVSIYQGGSFYIKSGKNYGRVEVEMISGKTWMQIRWWLNPSGSRNLEFDPAKNIAKPR